MYANLVAKVLREFVTDNRQRALLAVEFATELRKNQSFDELKFFRQCNPNYLDKWFED